MIEFLPFAQRAHPAVFTLRRIHATLEVAIAGEAKFEIYNTMRYDATLTERRRMCELIEEVVYGNFGDRLLRLCGVRYYHRVCSVLWEILSAQSVEDAEHAVDRYFSI